MTIKLRPMRELDAIRGKMLVGAASPKELSEFLKYVAALEGLVEDASSEDFFGSEGWQHHLGIDE
jgi:hypothetical protein